VLQGDGNDDGHHDDDRGKYFHHVHHEDEQVENDQEDELAADIVAHECEQLHRELLIDDVAGQPHGRAEHHQDRPDQDHAFPDYPGQVGLLAVGRRGRLPEGSPPPSAAREHADLAADEDFHDEEVHGREGGGLGG